MADVPARSLVVPATLLLASLGSSATARAELPEPADFKVEYFVTDEAGNRVRPMVERDHQQFINRARCQCGQQVGVDLKLLNPPQDVTTRLEAFIGTECATAETSLAGPFRRCGELDSALVPNYQAGIASAFHPAFLAHGVEPSSPTRSIQDPQTQLVSPCDSPVAGESGLWMCDPSDNSTAGCQKDEFFLAPDALAGLSGIPSLAYDFIPPLLDVKNLSVEPGNGAVVLSWEVPSSGDIHGYRVLCEEVDGGASPGLDFPAPDPVAVPDGDAYFTAGNLCGAEPFSTLSFFPADVTDPNTCGNGVVEPGEACDDGADNDDDGLCDSSCNLRVSPSLHALDWAHVCSDHIPFSTKSVVIDGLKNGVAYNFVLVPYDLVGNPRAHRHVVTATPDESLPDLVPDSDAQGCACTSDAERHGLLSVSLAALLLIARRRRRA